MVRNIKSIIKAIFHKISGVFHKSQVGSQISGNIKFFDKKKGFGFIVAEGRDYFFNVSATNPNDFRALKDGVAVKFTIGQGKKGLQAEKVALL